ncbi:unnamed protein product [Malus baccata var. baccata]
MNDARALGIIQGAVSDFIFPKIANEETAKAAWDTLQQEYKGDVKVQKVKLQFLRQLPNERIVQKLLISLTKPYDSIVSVIEKTKDTDTLSVQDVMNSLRAFDQRLERHADKTIEKAFQSLNIGSSSHSNQHQNRPRKDWKGKNKKWEGRPSGENRHNSGNNSGGGKIKPLCKYCDKAYFGECWFKGKPKCHKCNRFGHLQKDCRPNTTQQVNIANQVQYETNVFCAFSASVVKDSEVWYIDNGCSNHMTAHESLLTDTDTTYTEKVKMGNGNIVEATGRGTLIIETKKGIRHIKEVMLVPGLEENLLSVGQMMEHGYFLLFGDIMVEIYDDRTLSNLVVKVQMKNRSFPLLLNCLEEVARKANTIDSGRLWHKRFGHLNVLKNLQKHEMGEAVNTSVYILNRCPTKALEKQTPFQVFSGRKPGVKHLKVFGSVCYALVPSQLRHKLQESSNKCIFIGYGTNEKGYRLYNLKTQKINLSRDVIFDEETLWNWETKAVEEDKVSLQIGVTEQRTAQNRSGATHESEERSIQSSQISPFQTPQSSQNSSASSMSQQEEQQSSSSSSGSTPIKMKSLDEIYAACNFCVTEPETFEEAESDKAWQIAMKDEISIIEKNGTWILVDRPSDKPVIGVRWVYKTKLNLDGYVQKNKARFVAKGYSQNPGIDFNETFAPVARLDTIRTLITLAAQKGWQLYQLDV